MQDVPAQRIRQGRAQVGQLHVRVLPGHADLEFRGPEQPRHERPHDVDALDPIEPGPPVAAEDESAAHLDDLVADPEGVHAPGEVEAEQDQHEHDGDDEQRPADRAAPHDLVDRVAGVAGHAEEEVDQSFAEVRDDEAEHRDDEDPAAQQRAGRMQPVPFTVGEAGHSPARRLSASSTSRSRRLSASASARPGMSTPEEAAAVTNFRSARPSQRAIGPRVMSTSCIRP